jgi:4-carboxymuconolactone decarboxylase
MSEQDTFTKGLDLRRDMFGPDGAEKAIDNASAFTGPFQEMITRYCFGEVWQRPPLDRKTRSLLTLAILAVLSKPNQLKVHVRGAVQNGATVEEIREVLLHVMIYGGVPAAADSFGHAAEVLKELGLD